MPGNQKGGLPKFCSYFNFNFEQNYPNPFNPTTNIRFSITESAKISLKIYDVLGREVSVLVHERKAPGSYAVKLDEAGLASGIYLYRLTAGSFVQARKMILAR